MPMPRLSPLALGFTLLIAGCARDSEAASRGEVLHSLDPVVRWARDVHVQENPDAINVSISVAPYGGGDFLVSDAQEQQVRIYASDGTLKRTFGRRGSGPGEFQHIANAARLRDGRVLVADYMGPLTFFDSAGEKVVHTARSRLGPIYNLSVIDDSLVAFAGRKEEAGNATMLHVWNLRRDSLVADAFTVSPPSGYETAYNVHGVANLALRGDTIATLFSLKDTIFLFRTNGRPAGRIPIQFRAFRTLREPPPDDDPAGKRFREWMRSHSIATQIFWLADGSFLVQYFDIVGTTPQWRTAHVDRNGRSLAEVVGGSEILGTLPGDSLVFRKPGHDTPDVWSIGTIPAHQ
jgi:hypothetical protein